MSDVRAILPAPGASMLFAVFWLLLVNEVSAGQVLLAVAFGVALPLATRRLRAARPRLRRPAAAVELAALFLWDIVVANLAVARAVLGPISRIQPRFVRVPLDIQDPAAATLLAGMVTLTPGTVSVDVDLPGRALTVHMLLAADEQAAVGQIKSRYEARIREVFQC
jgi:multicomponent K+:H+ antiporter subunit E